MADYRLIYTDLKDGLVVGELPVRSFSFQEVFNSIGGLNASLILKDSTTIDVPGAATLGEAPPDITVIHTESKTFDTTKTVPLAAHDGPDRTAYLFITSKGSDQSAEVLGSMTGWTLALNAGDGNTSNGDHPRVWAYYKSIPSGTSDFTITHAGDGGWSLMVLEGSFQHPTYGYGFGIGSTVQVGHPGTLGVKGAIFGITATNDAVTLTSQPDTGIPSNKAYTSAPDGVYMAGTLPLTFPGDPWVYSASTEYSQAYLLIRETPTDPSNVTIEDPYVLDTPQLATLENLRPGSTGIYVERDGVIIWGGILWTLKMSAAAGTADIGAADFMSYLERIHIYQDLNYASADQGFIATDLVNKAMAKPGADIGLTAPEPITSKLRFRTYPAIERKSFGSAIQQLASVQLGFTWRFEHSWGSDGSTIDSTFRIDTSLLGRLTTYVFEIGTNVQMLDVTVDGSGMANYAEAWGQGEGGDGHFRPYYNSQSLQSSPLLETIETFSDVKSFDTLQEKAEQIISRGKVPLVRVEIGTFADTLPNIGSYEVGDRVKVRAPLGIFNLNNTFRIVSIDVAVDESNKESAKVVLAPQEAFS